MASIPVIQRKRGPAPTGQTPVTSIRLNNDVAAALDAWIAEQPEPRPGRSSAINSALREWLSEHPVPTSASVTHEIKALEQDLASIPAGEGQSPEAALHTMDRAIAENDLVELRHKRKRLRKAKPK